jgi:hypothetical protein
MSWFLVIFTAGFTHLGTWTMDRAIRTLDGPWPDRAQCLEALAQQQPLHHDGTLTCVWQMPPPPGISPVPSPQEDHAQPDRGA